MLKVHDLLESNVGRAKNKRLFIVSSCLVNDYPDIVSGVSREDDYIVSVCPEKHHINLIGYKIASFISYSGINEILVFTVDGSLHCIQLQYIVENIKKHFFKDIKVRHIVFSHGESIEIDEKLISLSRHLSRLQKNLSSE